MPRRPLATTPPTLYFELASPYTHLVAERADRLFSGLRWMPVCCDDLPRRGYGSEFERAGVERRAAALGIPLVWPTKPLELHLPALRAAALAAEHGAGAAFVIAANRLQFNGGYDMSGAVIAEAATAAAGSGHVISEAEIVAAAQDAGRDEAIVAAGRALVADGADRLPAIRVGSTLFCGEERLPEAHARFVAARRQS